MGFIDKRTEMSDVQDGGAFGTGANLADKAIPLSVARNIGNADQLFWVIRVEEEAVTSAGAAGVNFKLITDDNAAMGSNVSLVESGIIPKADLVIGYELILPLPVSDLYEEFLSVDYFVDTAALTAGKFSSYITDKIQQNRSYPNNISQGV